MGLAVDMKGTLLAAQAILMVPDQLVICGAWGLLGVAVNELLCARAQRERQSAAILLPEVLRKLRLEVDHQDRFEMGWGAHIHPKMARRRRNLWKTFNMASPAFTEHFQFSVNLIR